MSSSSSASSVSSVSSFVPVGQTLLQPLTRNSSPPNRPTSQMPPTVSPARPPSPPSSANDSQHSQHSEDDVCIVCLMPIGVEHNCSSPESPHDSPSLHTTTANSTPTSSPEELSTLEEGQWSPTTLYCCTSISRRPSPPPHSLPPSASSSPSSSSHTKPSSQPVPISACTCQPTIHPNCFHEWCMTNPVCPICRTPLVNATEYIRWSEMASLDSTSVSSLSSRRSRSPSVSVSCKVLMGIVFFGWVMIRILDPQTYPDDLQAFPNQSDVSHLSWVNDTRESQFVWIIPP